MLLPLWICHRTATALTPELQHWRNTKEKKKTKTVGRCSALVSLCRCSVLALMYNFRWRQPRGQRQYTRASTEHRHKRHQRRAPPTTKMHPPIHQHQTKNTRHQHCLKISLTTPTPRATPTSSNNKNNNNSNNDNQHHDPQKRLPGRMNPSTRSEKQEPLVHWSLNQTLSIFWDIYRNRNPPWTQKPRVPLFTQQIRFHLLCPPFRILYTGLLWPCVEV